MLRGIENIRHVSLVSYGSCETEISYGRLSIWDTEILNDFRCIGSLMTDEAAIGGLNASAVAEVRCHAHPSCNRLERTHDYHSMGYYQNLRILREYVQFAR